MDPKEFLTLAEALLRGTRASNDGAFAEAIHRTIVGRAYYAAFLRARKYMQEKHGDPHKYSRSDVHTKLLADPEDRGATGDEQKAGRKLRRLKRRRTTADYEPHSRSNWAREATDAIQEAGTVFSLLS